MIPHVTGEVKHRVRQLAMTGGPDGAPADVVFVEVGGTVGDYENGFYIEALRELAFEEGDGSVCFAKLGKEIPTGKVIRDSSFKESSCWSEWTTSASSNSDPWPAS